MTGRRHERPAAPGAAAGPGAGPHGRARGRRAAAVARGRPALAHRVPGHAARAAHPPRACPARARPCCSSPRSRRPGCPTPDGMITLRPWAETEDPVALAAALLAPAVGRHLRHLGPGLGARRCWRCRRACPAPAGWRPRGSRPRCGPSRTPTRSPRCGPRPTPPTRWPRCSRRARSRWSAAREIQVSEAIGAGLLAAGHRRVNFAIVGSGPNGASPHHEAGRAGHRSGRHGGVRLRG